jgi:hypothetical protein
MTVRAGIDPKLFDKQAIAMHRWLWHKLRRVNVVQMIEVMRDPDPVEHALRIRGVAVGE